jgi:hypothetical protein
MLLPNSSHQGSEMRLPGLGEGYIRKPIDGPFDVDCGRSDQVLQQGNCIDYVKQQQKTNRFAETGKNVSRSAPKRSG